MPYFDGFDKDRVFAEFNDTINIIEGLSKSNYLNFISRKSKKRGNHKALIKNMVKIKISEIKNFDFKNKKIHFKDGHKIEYDFLISTMPIDKLFNFKEKKLNYTGYRIKPKIINRKHFAKLDGIPYQ